MTKELLVNNYMTSLNSKEFSVKEIKENLKKILHEEPAIQLEYEKEKMLSEDLKETVIVEKLKCIKVYFTEIDDNTKELTYYI